MFDIIATAVCPIHGAGASAPIRPVIEKSSTEGRHAHMCGKV